MNPLETKQIRVMLWLTGYFKENKVRGDYSWQISCCMMLSRYCWFSFADIQHVRFNMSLWSASGKTAVFRSAGSEILSFADSLYTLLQFPRGCSFSPLVWEGWFLLHIVSILFRISCMIWGGSVCCFSLFNTNQEHISWLSRFFKEHIAEMIRLSIPIEMNELNTL